MILKGNCLDTLKTLPDCSVDSIVTDPPYELGFMGKSWDNSGIAYNQDLWAECLRVLKPGGHLLAFSGSRTYHRMVVAIEDSGFEIRDQIMWIYGSGFPKSLDVSKAIDKAAGLLKDESKGFTVAGRTDANLPNPITKNYKPPLPATPEAQQWQGWGTALKPAHEPIVVARKPLIGTVANNVLTYGTGALNIDGSRVGTTEKLSIGSNNRQNALINFGMKDNKETQEQNLHGRWPANVIHDGSDEVLAGFPYTKSGAKKSGQRGNGNDGIIAFCKTNPVYLNDFAADEGSAARFFKSTPIDEADTQSFIYCAKASKSERNAGLEGLPERETGVYAQDEWSRNNMVSKPTMSVNFHPTVKPLALMRYLIKLVTPPGGTVLDPFLGSGTTAVAAILEGFEWIGCEMTEDYFPIIEARVVWAENQPKTLI